MLSKEQLAEEQRKEAEYNKLFESIISKSPFGKFYGLMIGASNLLTKNLPKRVGIDEDGRPLVVYKGDLGKLLGVWAVPTHKVIAEDLSRKDYAGAVGAFFGIGQIVETVKQKKAKFFDISPDEVTQVYNEKLSEAKAKSTKIASVSDSKITKSSTAVKNTPEDKIDVAPPKKAKKNYKPIIIGSVIISIGLLIGCFIYKQKKA